LNIATRVLTYPGAPPSEHKLPQIYNNYANVDKYQNPSHCKLRSNADKLSDIPQLQSDM